MRPERQIYGWFQRPIIGTALLGVALHEQMRWNEQQREAVED